MTQASQNPPQRYRGFILTSAGLRKLQEQIQCLETQTRVRQNPRTIAERVQLVDPDGIHPITVRKILSHQQGVDKRSIKRVFRALQLQLEQADYAHAGLCLDKAETQQTVDIPDTGIERLLCSQNWDEAIAGTSFYGRARELTDLKQHILTESCRLMMILGVAGVGKTALMLKLACELVDDRQQANQAGGAHNRETIASAPAFDYVVWQSLRQAPSVQKVLISILQSLPADKTHKRELPATVEELIPLLLDQLQQYRCLLILDQMDAVLGSDPYAGYYRDGYEAYNELLKSVIEVPHQSCVVLTSREKPKVFGILDEGWVRSLQLGGLAVQNIQQIFQEQGNFTGSQAEWRSAVEHYAGNPLVLKRVAAGIQKYFNGSLTEYLKDGQGNRLILNDLQDILSSQCERLSEYEQKLMSYLALQDKWISLAQLRNDTLSLMQPRCLLEGLDSLNRRSLLNWQGSRFRLYPLVTIYINEYLIEKHTHEPITFQPKLEIPKTKIQSHRELQAILCQRQ